MKKPRVTYRLSDGKGNTCTITTTRGEDAARRQYRTLVPWCDPSRLTVSRQCARDGCKNFTARANGLCSRHNPEAIS